MIEPKTSRKTFEDFGNPQVAALPHHLKKYIVDQYYDHYTPVDHALWRYVMRQNYSYLKDAAYYPYIPGLRKAGLTIEKIPSLQEMNDALGKIGWGAVTVDGFIPPAAFMEYQARKVLVIAADIRQLDHIEYTSAPDIIHESAGHAPIISDTKYNQYLSYLGYVGTKALFSAKDYELYEAIRQLSILKEIPNVEQRLVAEAEEKVLYLQKNLGAPSEMAMLSRLQWWTVEYGLIGSLSNPKIYGAGLLSSIGESSWCMRPEVKKIVYTIEAKNFSYDITQPQPQLFVTPTFQNLIDVLQEFESEMAWRKGGSESLNKAIECRNICTTELDSGIQITGIFDSISVSRDGNIHHLRTTGPSALCRKDMVIDGFDPKRLPNGYMTILGNLLGSNQPIHQLTKSQLQALGLKKDTIGTLTFQNGWEIHGVFLSADWHEEHLQLIHFKEATIRHRDGAHPSETYEFFSIAPATRVVSVVNGSVDKSAFPDEVYVSKERTGKFNYTQKDVHYQRLFQRIRAIRETEEDIGELRMIREELITNFPSDWLATLELVELSADREELKELYQYCRAHLEELAANEKAFTKLIRDGLGIVDKRLVFE